LSAYLDETTATHHTRTQVPPDYADGVTADRIEIDAVADGVARIRWHGDLRDREFVDAVTLVTAAVEEALSGHGRVEALVDPADEAAQRIATWSGLHREGIMRGGVLVDGQPSDRIVYARLADDPPISEPSGFRGLLNSFLPRKRAISQMLIRDQEQRVLLCQLTYKRDWDLPGGVVEVGESPRLAVGREVDEELGLTIEPGPILLTDWLPPWGGWDDAVCLVFDGGVHPTEIVEKIVRQEREIRAAEFCTPEQVAMRCADYTTRRIAAALTSLGRGPSYTESGRRETEQES
jgi:8-oxo-dGTP pyrophosphatase MutT (NUDIX family)